MWLYSDRCNNGQDGNEVIVGSGSDVIVDAQTTNIQPDDDFKSTSTTSTTIKSSQVSKPCCCEIIVFNSVDSDCVR